MTTTTRKIETIGTLEVNESLIISDPCYSKGTWCMAENVELPHGTYNCCVCYNDENRVASIEITLEDYDRESNEYVEGEPLEDTLGVDSGQLGIFVQSKYREGISKELYMKSLEVVPMCEGWFTPYSEEMSADENFYNCCGNYTLSTQKCGVMGGIGFVSSSGYGDGCYHARLLYNIDETKVVGLKVYFIEDEEE